MLKKFLVVVFSLWTSVGATGPIEDIKVGEWGSVGVNRIRNVVPVPRPYGNPAAVINAWSGGWHDTIRDWYCVTGGGHGDYAGNEVYCFDLATMQWTRIWGPTPTEFIPPKPATIGETYANGDPRSRHTYSGVAYLPNVNKYFVHGGSLWSGSGGMGKATWAFDPGLGTWTRLASIAPAYSGSAAVPYAAYDPTTGTVLVHQYTRLVQYDPIANTWVRRGQHGAGTSPNATSVFDIKRKQFCLIGGKQGVGKTMCYDMMRTDNAIPLQVIPTTGEKTVENASYPGLAYDPISELIVGWAGGTDVYTLDLTTREWTKVPAAETNTVTPTAPTHTGTHGRWQYVPSKGTFVVVNGIDQQVYVYRWRDVDPPPIPIPELPLPPGELIP